MSVIIAVLTLLLAVIFACNSWVIRRAEGYLFDDLTVTPVNKVGLVLGCAPYLAGGGKNLFFQYRIEAAVSLYEQGKIRFILVSGDNAQASYNEPRAMQQALVARGIPSQQIVLDYAGFRTLDSVVRAKAVFNETKITIISQKFHNQRALFIAHAHGLEAIAFNAQEVSAYHAFRTRLREYIARIKAVLDVYLLHTEPKYYGPRITIAGMR